MTKIQILDINGKKTKEITTKLFEEPIRKDIIYKIVEAEKIKHPSSNKFNSGMNRSASGLLRRTRKVWKSDRGKGLSRIPRKIMSRRGTQFNWVAAIIPSARGGRRAHPPKAFTSPKKINKKEMQKALLSALTYTTSIEEIQRKYASLADKKITIKLPIVVEEKFLKLKTKESFESLQNILGELYSIAIQKSSIRAGVGKTRGRKHKKNAGLLLLIGKQEKIKLQGVEVLNVDQVSVSDLASNGARLVIFSENAINELEKFGNKSGENHK